MKIVTKVTKKINTNKLNYKIMEKTIIFKAQGAINLKSTVNITLYDQADKERPYTVQIITSLYDNKLKEYLISDVSTKYFYKLEEALVNYITNLQWKISFGYSIHKFQEQPININL